MRACTTPTTNTYNSTTTFFPFFSLPSYPPTVSLQKATRCNACSNRISIPTITDLVRICQPHMPGHKVRGFQTRLMKGGSTDTFETPIEFMSCCFKKQDEKVHGSIRMRVVPHITIKCRLRALLTYGALLRVYMRASYHTINKQMTGPRTLRHHPHRRLPVLASRMRCYCCSYVVCFESTKKRLRAPAYNQGKYYGGGLQQGTRHFYRPDAACSCL